MAPETGSVAMKTSPKAKPPRTRCQRGPSSNIGLELLPTITKSVDKHTAPISPESMMRQDPIPERTRTAAPKRQARADVSPIDPVMAPTKASYQLVAAVTACSPPSAAWLRAVAPLTPSTAVQTMLPEICAG